MIELASSLALVWYCAATPPEVKFAMAMVDGGQILVMREDVVSDRASALGAPCFRSGVDGLTTIGR